jgi:tagatose 6-phosphate kinase
MTVDSDSGLPGAMIELVGWGRKMPSLSLGADGALAFDGLEISHISSPKVTAVNSVGSGDAFTAGLAAGLVEGQSLAEACRLGAACGAANALTLFAGEVSAEDVKSLLEQTSITRV